MIENQSIDLERRLQQANEAIRGGRLGAAQAIAAELYPRFPQSPYVHALIAELAGRAGNQDVAKRWFQSALEIDPHAASIHARFADLLETVGELAPAHRHLKQAVALMPSAALRLNLGLLLDKLGEPDLAIEQLLAALNEAPTFVDAWQALGAIQRDLGNAAEAEIAFRQVVRLQPTNPLGQRSLAMLCTEIHGDVDASFDAIPSALRSNSQIRLAEANARYVAGETVHALSMLEELVEARPDDLQLQRTLAESRWQAGDSSGFLERCEQFLVAQPRHGPMWAMMLRLLMRTGRHEQVLERLSRARAAVGPSATLDVIEANALSALGDLARAERCFVRNRLGQSGEALLAYLSFLLKCRRPDEVVHIAAPLVEEALAPHLYPLLGIAWRLLDDPRWTWLEGDPRLVSVADLDIDVNALATVLRRLHSARAQPLEQSLRGGTQTDGPLLLRGENEIKVMRQAFEGAIATHIAQLPPVDAEHPTLGPMRGPVRFTGCWSVRLTAAGFHVNHMHSEGWLSSAFYVTLPPIIEEGVEGQRAGWLSLGQPPQELALDLPATRYIRPAPARLAIFPSTMWHGTLPFESGERLTVAFDVVPRSSGIARLQS